MNSTLIQMNGEISKTLNTLSIIHHYRYKSLKFIFLQVLPKILMLGICAFAFT